MQLYSYALDNFVATTTLDAQFKRLVTVVAVKMAHLNQTKLANFVNECLTTTVASAQFYGW